MSVGAGDVDGVGCVEACMAEGCGGVVGVGYLVDGVDCHAVVGLFVGGGEEDSVVGVEGFPVEEGGDGSHCWCSLSVFNDWGGKPCGAYWVRWWVEVFSQPLMPRLYHIFAMCAP